MGKDKKKTSKHKKHKRSKHVSSSNESSSTDEEWVEAPVPSSSQPQQTTEKKQTKNIPEVDDWISNPAAFPCVSMQEIRKNREKKKDKNEEYKYMLDKLGQTNRELNPYWKDGGSGLPAQIAVTADSLRQASVTVGDQGAAWLRKALQRAKEQAADQGRSLQQVVAERWGSLEKLESMIAAAEERDKKLGKYSQVNKHKYRRDNIHSQDRFDDRTFKEEKYKSERYDKYEKDSRNKTKILESNGSSDNSSDTDEEYNNKGKSGRETNRSFTKPDKDENRRGKHVSKFEEGKKRDKKPFAKPDDSNEDSSDSTEDRARNKQYSRENNSKKRFAKPSHSSSEDERNSKKHGRSKYNVSENSKKTISSKGFVKPSVSSSSEDEVKTHSLDKRNKSVENRNKEMQKGITKESRKTFVKPHHDSEEDSSSRFSRSRAEQFKSYSSSSKGWRKKTVSQVSEEKPKYDEKLESDLPEKSSITTEENAVEKNETVLTDQEMNDLGAKIIKAELLGNQELADELKAKLDNARAAKANRPKEADISEEVVILTHTDSKGFTRPVSLGGPMEPTGGRRKAKKVDTHSGGKRTRYFADDDKYSLQEMFQREKLSTVEDSNEVFAKLASKGVGRDNSARDMDDVFEETARTEEAEGRKQTRDRQQAIKESKKTARSLDNCQWCLESQQMLKHLIIAIGRTCYLCVPSHQSLTENHCLIVPTHHTPCTTLLDEDVWAEMRDIRKSVVQMFLSQDEDVVFFESARSLNRFPHMVLNCVPMPKETGDLAPIYFKKAIQECEMEWSNNKKLVDLRGKDVRKAIPKGLPYFAVDFGMESGFAHVIEDETLFPINFAQEIIGGMLDLDHTIWRKQRKQTFEDQSKKVIQLAKLWSPFDCTKKK